MSSAICLVGMLLFAFTGITLNHASEIEAEAIVEERQAVLPDSLRDELTVEAVADAPRLPNSFRDWAAKELSLDVSGREAEWSEDELYVPLPRPGGDGWLSVDLPSGEVLHQDTERGWIAWLNDLHKGRDTGSAWSWFIDGFAVACIVFCVTGFFLLQLHARNRKSTWPIVGAGVLIPLLLIVLFMHN